MPREIPYRDVDIDRVREYAAVAANRTSLRTLAPEIGLGHSTLHNFLGGAAPHPRVRTALCKWYLRETGAGEDVRAALETLSAYFPAEVRPDVQQALLGTMAESFRKLDMQAPDWLAKTS